MLAEEKVPRGIVERRERLLRPAEVDGFALGLFRGRPDG